MAFKTFKSIKDDIDGACIEMFSNRRMIIYDCQYVIDYSKEHIVLCIGALNVKIRGDNLVLSSFSYGETSITGDIVTVEFEKVR
ncbi:MAG: YabP/YqfC family sporulation protein [Oscillospiraceae bacterium]|nr:YabP/YqfC family sporulation protein [Oscillospiraceae bacterium]